jgi:hypothetical protein
VRRWLAAEDAPPRFAQQTVRSNLLQRWFLLLVALAFAAGCSKQKPEIIGKWRPIDVENREATMEFLANGKLRFNSAESLDWMLVGQELNITHPEARTRPISARVSLPDEQYLDVAILDPQTGKYASHRRFKRIVDGR